MKHSMGVQKCMTMIKSVSCVNVIVMLITLKITFKNIKTKQRQKYDLNRTVFMISVCKIQKNYTIQNMCNSSIKSY